MNKNWKRYSHCPLHRRIIFSKNVFCGATNPRRVPLILLARSPLSLLLYLLSVMLVPVCIILFTPGSEPFISRGGWSRKVWLNLCVSVHLEGTIIVNVGADKPRGAVVTACPRCHGDHGLNGAVIIQWGPISSRV